MVGVVSSTTFAHSLKHALIHRGANKCCDCRAQAVFAFPAHLRCHLSECDTAYGARERLKCYKPRPEAFALHECVGEAHHLFGNIAGCAHHLTRLKISDRWRERAWLQVKYGSHCKLERGAASGSLHRLVRRLHMWKSAV